MLRKPSRWRERQAGQLPLERQIAILADLLALRRAERIGPINCSPSMQLTISDGNPFNPTWRCLSWSKAEELIAEHIDARARPERKPPVSVTGTTLKEKKLS